MSHLFFLFSPSWAAERRSVVAGKWKNSLSPPLAAYRRLFLKFEAASPMHPSAGLSAAAGKFWALTANFFGLTIVQPKQQK